MHQRALLATGKIALLMVFFESDLINDAAARPRRPLWVVDTDVCVWAPGLGGTRLLPPGQKVMAMRPGKLRPRLWQPGETRRSR
jgi:hypothetical protein